MQVFDRCVYSFLSTAKKINISSAQGKLGCDNSWITNLDHFIPSQVVFNEDAQGHILLLIITEHHGSYQPEAQIL